MAKRVRPKPPKLKASYTVEERTAALMFMEENQHLTMAEVSEQLGIKHHTLLSWKNKQRNIMHGLDAIVSKKADAAVDEAIQTDANFVSSVLEVEARKQQIILQIEEAVMGLIPHMAFRVEDANLSTIVQAIDTLLNRVEQMSYRPRAEAREDELVKGLSKSSESDEGTRARLESAVIQALRQKGHLASGASDESDTN